MTSIEYSNINENNNLELELGKLTLSQGEKFKKYQNKIAKNVEKKDLLLEGFQGLQGDLSSRMSYDNTITSKATTSQTIINTRGLIKETDINVTTQIKHLQELQKKFERLLNQYNGANTSLIDATKKYIQNNVGDNVGLGENSKRKSTNIYVNSVANNVKETYLGCYKDTSNRAMSGTAALSGQYVTYDQCKQTAIDGAFKYFGLQDFHSENQSGWCAVSNDLNATKQYGDATNCVQGSNGNMYGGGWSNAVYELDKVGNKDDLGKVGYLDEDSKLSEYPASMFTIDKSNKMSMTMAVPIINNNDSCTKRVETIDSLEWDNYAKTGLHMSQNTVCGLEKKTQDEIINRDALRMQLAALADEIVNKITYLESLNLSMNNQMGIDKKVLNDNLKKYKSLSKQYNQYKNVDAGNINGILSDSSIVVLQENYSYLFWSILAIAIVVVTIHTIKK